MATQPQTPAVMPDAMATGQANIRKVYDDTSVQARAALEQGVQQANKTAGDLFKAAAEFGELSRGNLEAITGAAQTWATGLLELNRQYVAMVQGLTSQAVEDLKALAAAKSLQEAVGIQASLARGALERAMSETAKLQEAAFSLAQQAFAPLTQRATLGVEKLARPVAA